MNLDDLRAAFSGRLHTTPADTEMKPIRALKAAFDPRGSTNPGKAPGSQP